MRLVTDYNLGATGDDLYAALLDAHDGLTGSESAALNARLVLILINHIGDEAIIHAAIDAALRAVKNGPVAAETAG